MVQRMADVHRLGPGNEAVAREMFAVVATVFAEADEGAGACGPLPEDYVTELLRRVDFWALAATEEGAVVGGLTAHALPMTRNRSTELFIYDLAVRADRQRRGIGRALVAELLTLARKAGIDSVFVPAENEDTHALEFYRTIGGASSAVTFFTFSAVR